MTIWLLALLILASLAGLGLRQGAIRVAFSTVGILAGIFAAGLFGQLLRPILGIFGVKNPILAYLLGPLVVFIVVSIIFKVAAYSVHQKVDVYYKYKAGDLRLALWERLNHRLGLCLGLLNGALYVILVSYVIYGVSYWTAQLATEGADGKLMSLVTKMGRDLDSSGFVKVARAAAPYPESWYQGADLAGVLYNNPLLEARLSRYPGFLGLSESQEFQDMGSDTAFTEMWQRRVPLKEFLDYPKVQAIVNNPELLRAIWKTVQPDLGDLPKYLETGRSPKYASEPILGRWNFDVNAALGNYLRANPNIASSEMQKTKKWLLMGFSKTSLTARTDHQLSLKNAPQLTAPVAGGIPAPGNQTLQGTWKNADGKYQLTLAGAADLNATVDDDKMTITGAGTTFIFNRED